MEFGYCYACHAFLVQVDLGDLTHCPECDGAVPGFTDWDSALVREAMDPIGRPE